jgi:hypothetical protein
VIVQGVTSERPDPGPLLSRLSELAEAARAEYGHHARAPQFSAAQLELVVDCLNAGCTWQAIADALDRKQPNVVASFKPYIITEVHHRVRPDLALTDRHTFGPDEVARVVDDLNAGYTWQAIADNLDRARANVMTSFKPYIITEVHHRIRTDEDNEAGL